MRRRGKRGSLELSANAIVILIIAITILGLGLGFVRGLFSTLKERFITEAAGTKITEPPTAARPITMVESLTLERGKDMPQTIGYYHNKNCGMKNLEYVPVFSTCVSSEDRFPWEVDDLPVITAIPKLLECGDVWEYSVTIRGGSDMSEGKSICQVDMQNVSCIIGSVVSYCLSDPASLQIVLEVP